MARKSKKLIEAEKRLASKAAEKAAEKAAAEIAAKEAIEEMEEEEYVTPEQRDISFALNQEENFSDHELDERDGFVEGRKVGSSRNKPVTFRVYIDNEWVATKPSNYSWEKLRKDFPKGGSVKIVAIDRDNKYAASQTLQVAPDEEALEPRSSNNYQPQVSQHSSLEMLELMKENQREAEAKSQSQQTGLASIMSSMVQMQSQNSQMMMTLFQKSSEQTQNLLIAMMTKNSEPKGPDPMLALVTTLLTQKPAETGPKAMELIKMLEDAKRDAKREAKEDAKDRLDMAKKMAEEMTPDSDGEESLTKTIIKSLGPVIADVMVKKQQADEQQAAAIALNQRQLGNRGLEAGFLDDRMNRPAIPAANPQRPRPQVTKVAAAPVPQPPAGASVSPEGVQAQPIAPKGPVEVQQAKEIVVDSRLQEQLFNFCAADIGQALMLGHAAPATAALCLGKLEKEGISRQTVSKAFKIEDFYAYAEKFQIPDEAKPWLKEFHESIAIKASPKPVRAPADTGVASRDNGTNGNKPPVAADGSQTPRPGTRAQPRERVKDF